MILENDVLSFMPQRVYDQRAVRHTNTQFVRTILPSTFLSQLVSHSLSQSASQYVDQLVSQSISQTVISQSVRRYQNNYQKKLSSPFFIQ